MEDSLKWKGKVFIQWPLKANKGGEKTDPIFGIVFIVIGLFLLISGVLKRRSGVYRLMTARSSLLWGKNVHRFYMAVGLILIILGILVSLEMIWQQ